MRNHDTARRFATYRVPPRIFKPRLQQIPFVIAPMRTGRIVCLERRGVVTEHDIEPTVRTQRQPVRRVLAHFTFKRTQQLGTLELTVAVLIGEPIESTPFRTGTRDIDIPIERQNALDVFHEVAVGPELVDDFIVIRIDGQQQPFAFARQDQMAEFIERHGNQRTRGVRIEYPLDLEFFFDVKAFRLLRSVVRDRLFVIPGRGFAQLAKLLRFLPGPVVVERAGPERQRIEAGPPRRVGRISGPAARLFANRDARDKCRGGAVTIGHLHRNHVRTGFDEFRDVVLVQAPR